ncbi:MAG: hypothetical protein LBP59_08120 [Planctomycetaceae bacterium]|jgi:hypothetical protein|nr:hypothetical protein [Planctomycetaceae bacterium]
MKRAETIFFVTKNIFCVVGLFFVMIIFIGVATAENLSDYIRVSKQEGKLHPTSLDTPIVKFENKKSGVEVMLIGAVHIADKKYYDELNDEFKKYEAVLFELVVANENKDKNNKLDKSIFDKKRKNTYKEFQGGFGEILELTHQVDHIDYKAENMIHADLTMDEFLKRMAARGDWFNELAMMMLSMSEGGTNELELEGRLLGSMLASNPALSFKRNFARLLTSKLADTSKLFPKDATAIITDRNAEALKVLKKEIKKGSKKIAIFYGCAHLPEFATSLKKDFNLKKTETKWIVAWDLTKNKSARKKNNP